MLSVEDWVVSRDERVLFGPVSFSLTKGELLHIKGENGAGKSSLLKSLLGFIAPEKGNIKYDSQALPDSIGFIGHRLGLTPTLSVSENLEYLAFNAPQNMTANEAITCVDLQPESETFISALSEGQKKRAALARFFYLKKALWVLDEPFSALDVAHQESFSLALASYLKEGGMVILTSHLPFEVQGIKVKEISLT
jgi:heme exporter protein A